MKLILLYEADGWRWGRFAGGVAAPIVLGLGLGAGRALTRPAAAPDVSPQAVSAPERPAVVSKPVVPQAEPPTPQRETTYDFDMPSFRKRLEQFEGRHRRAYPVQKGEMAIGIGHTMRNPTLSGDPTAPSRRAFRQVFGDEVDFDAVLAQRELLSDAQVDKLADYDIAEHIRRARATFPRLSMYPSPVQHAIVDAIYRGDMGPQTARLINAGKWAEAADEYINHRGYRTARARGLGGIVTRMDANRRVFLDYAHQLARGE